LPWGALSKRCAFADAFNNSVLLGRDMDQGGSAANVRRHYDNMMDRPSVAMALKDEGP
jgi:hypothetical protein